MSKNVVKPIRNRHQTYQKYTKNLEKCRKTDKESTPNVPKLRKKSETLRKKKSVQNDRAGANGQRQAILEVHSGRRFSKNQSPTRTIQCPNLMSKFGLGQNFEYKITIITMPNPRKIWRKARAGPYMGAPTPCQ